MKGSDSGLVTGRDARLSGQTVAGRDVHMAGTNVAGRDVVVHQHLQQIPSAPIALFQLPPDTKEFTDRHAELAWVHGLVNERRRSDTALMVVAIVGKPGVGKTTLAIRAAHQLKEDFPDGQLYIDLRGGEVQRRHPGDVLSDLLSVMGVDRTGIPDGLDGRAALYRDRLANRRMLVLLDNAATVKQVRPLLPGSSSCVVVVTSRGQLAGLPGESIVLEVFNEAEAVQLLRKVVGTDGKGTHHESTGREGRDRISQEPNAASAIAESCGYLPLALSIAGAKLKVRPHLSLKELSKGLRNEGRRLSELEIGDLEVRATFALSYDDLAGEEQQAFRLLGLLRDFATWTAAALLDRDLDHAKAVVENLVDAQLLECTGQDATGQVRYRFHDLIRDFARERLAREGSENDRQQALARVLDAYVELTMQAGIALEARAARSGGGDDDADNVSPGQPEVVQTLRQDPLRWFMVERANLVTAVQEASQAERWRVTVELAGALDAFFRRTAQWDDWQRTQEFALAAARRIEDPRWEATSLRNLGGVYWEQSNRKGNDPKASKKARDAAVDAMETALQGFRELGDRHETAVTLLELGRIHREQEQWEDAFARLDEALSEFRELNDAAFEGATLRSLGKFYLDQGYPDDARALLDQALAILTKIGNPHEVALTLRDLGLTDRAQQHLDEAVGHLEQAIGMFGELGDRRYEYVTRADLGNVHHDQGHSEEAVQSFEQAQTVFRELGDGRWEGRVLLRLGKLYRDQGHLESAVASLEQALAVFSSIQDHHWEARALGELSSVRAKQQ